MFGLLALVLVVSPPHLQAASGWHVGSRPAQTCPGVPASRCVQAPGWASTVRYRDCGDCVPPHRTLVHLPPNGIVIQLSNSRERPVYKMPLGWPPRLRASQVVGPFEGEPPQYGVIQLGRRDRSGVEHFLYVWFGRPHPTRHQLARANAELRTVR